MKKKLLLADDSITIQRVVGIIFADEDYQLLTAADGDRAYELALEEKPDLVIADIAMPGKDGFELCRAIKAAESLTATSVLLLPGVFEEFDEAKAAEVCADGWLTKPFESQAMIDKVRSLLATPPLRLDLPSPETVTEEAAPEEDWATAAFDREWITPAFEETTSAGRDAEAEVAEPALTTTQDEMTESGEDSNIWGAVSFDEEDLRADEDTGATAAEDEDFVFGPAEDGETVGDVAEEEDEILAAVGAAAEGAADESDYAGDFSYVQDQSNEPQEPSSSGYGDFSFSGDVDETAEEDAEVLELMESDLEEGGVLVEEGEPFIDEQAEDASVQSPPSTAAIYPTFSEEDVVSEEEDILELTEDEIVAEEAAVAEEGTAAEDGEETLEDEDAAEPEDEYEDAGRLFADDEEEGSAFAAEAEEDAGAPVDELFDDEEAEPLEVEEVAESEDTVRVFTEDAEEDFADAAETEEDSDAAVEELFEDEVAEPSGVDDNRFAAAFDEEEAAEPLGVSAARVEEQLQALSQEELTAIVERVAGPLIEKLAAQMLEKIAWEVVPDLAETMISAEIEKIKQGDR